MATKTRKGSTVRKPSKTGGRAGVQKPGGRPNKPVIQGRLPRSVTKGHRR